MAQPKVLWVVCVWSHFLFYTHGYSEGPATCEPIRVTMCSHLKYNKTRMPNFLGHQRQQDAINALNPYTPLEDSLTCSPHIKFFLCSLFVPMCTDQMDGPLVIKVCRSMCLQIKEDCSELLKMTGFKLNCSWLPEESSTTELCMAPKDIDAAGGIGGRPVIPMNTMKAPISHSKNYAQPSSHKVRSSLVQDCPENYVKYDNSTCTDLCNPACKDCVPDCSKDVYFTKQNKNLAYIWMAIWSILCLISTLFTLATFCIDTTRFRYPARPIIFTAFCYLMVSATYLIRLFMPAKEIMCKQDDSGPSVVIMDGIESTLCIVIFLIQYYFGMASNIWWVVLTFTWYLAASRKWGLEAINSIACYFHLVAWALPAVLTIAILVTGKVDSQELTGMCYVGNHDQLALLLYVIAPLALLLLLGDIFILSGFCSLFRTRTNLKSSVDDANIRKLEKLMAKVGIFSILYSVPAVCVLGAHIYESINMNTWRCLSADQDGRNELERSIPTVEIHMLKIFMCLATGITISMWVLSAKTLRSCEKRLCRKKDRPQRNQNQSYMVAVPTNRNAFVQHYNFPLRQESLCAYNKPFNLHERKV